MNTLLRFSACLALALLGGLPGFGAARPKLVMLVAEPEYKTIETLPAFAARHLERDFDVVLAAGSTAAGETTFDRIGEVARADVLLVSVWRRTPPQEQMALIRRHIESGKGVVGLRTASHAFSLRRNAPPPAGHADWPEWDAQVFGGNYTGHYGKGIVTTIVAIQEHPLLAGVTLPFTSEATLYKCRPLKPHARALLVGTVPDQPAEPIAYIATHVGGGRAFYTSLGDPTDFENASFRQLLINALRWTAGQLEPTATASRR